jgi:hypothetical protein
MFCELFCHDESRYIVPQQALVSRIPQIIAEAHAEAMMALKESGKQHVVYATKRHNEAGALSRVDLYCVPLDDAEFDKRTDAAYNEKECDWIGAVHAR